MILGKSQLIAYKNIALGIGFTYSVKYQLECKKSNHYKFKHTHIENVFARGNENILRLNSLKIKTRTIKSLKRFKEL